MVQGGALPMYVGRGGRVPQLFVALAVCVCVCVCVCGAMHSNARFGAGFVARFHLLFHAFFAGSLQWEALCLWRSFS